MYLLWNGFVTVQYTSIYYTVPIIVLYVLNIIEVTVRMHLIVTWLKSTAKALSSNNSYWF